MKSSSIQEISRAEVVTQDQGQSTLILRKARSLPPRLRHQQITPFGLVNPP